MINWDSVDKEGIVVRLPTEESIDEFFDELTHRYPGLHTPSEYVSSRLQKYGYQAAVYVCYRGYNGGYAWEYCDYDWYANVSPYCDCEFCEWTSSIADFGDIESESAIDLSLLFSNEEVLL